MCWQTKQVSSAYRNNSQSATWLISLTCCKYNKGPKIDPCCTPQSKLSILDFFWIFTQKRLLERQDSNQFFYWFENPREVIFLSNISWILVSKAFCKLTRISPVNIAESIFVIILPVKCEREVYLDWFLRNPDRYK